MINKDRKIREKLQQKTWNEIKTNDSWAIFKIMSEFVDGYEKLSKIGPCVSIFGSARTLPNEKYYQLAEEIAFKLTQNGYGVITGGGPGIMEAGNKGAHRGKGVSVGLNIDLPSEQHDNPWINRDKNLNFDYLQLYDVDPEKTLDIKKRLNIKIISSITVQNLNDVC